MRRLFNAQSARSFSSTGPAVFYSTRAGGRGRPFAGDGRTSNSNRHHRLSMAGWCWRGGARRCITTEDDPTGVLGQPLETEPWPFNSVLLDTEPLMHSGLDTSDFTTRLLVTVLKLRNEGRSSMWVRVPMLQCHLIPILAIHGFRFHHTEPEAAYLNLWLRRPSENKIPPFATHLVGVAGLVMNRANDILMVKEQSKKYAGWKLPGGYANLGEDFGAAACREVNEETGIKTEFKSILSFRHQHNMIFGRSDIYVICRLKALSDKIVIDHHEIEDVRWTPLDKFRRDASHPILRVVSQLTFDLEKANNDTSGEDGITPSDIIETEHESIIPGRPPFKLYHRQLPPSPAP